MLQCAAETRTEPPVSVPSASAHNRVRTATPERPDDPPGMQVVFHGLRARDGLRSRVGNQR